MRSTSSLDDGAPREPQVPDPRLAARQGRSTVRRPVTVCLPKHHGGLRSGCLFNRSVVRGAWPERDICGQERCEREGNSRAGDRPRSRSRAAWLPSSWTATRSLWTWSGLRRIHRGGADCRPRPVFGVPECRIVGGISSWAGRPVDSPRWGADNAVWPRRVRDPTHAIRQSAPTPECRAPKPCLVR